MKEKRKERKYWCIISSVFAALVLIATLVGIYNVLKPLPSGISYEGEVHNLSLEDVEFLYDLTYKNASGSKKVEQEIFSRIFELIDNAKRIIIIDAFLFNDDYVGNDSLIQITKSLRDKLIAKKHNSPNITIIFITDEINNFYGSYTSSEIKELEAGNISVIVTDMIPLRDSNPFYSGFWRTYIRWFGTEGIGSLKHPLGNQENNVTLRAFLKLLNTKANHRKVLIADMENSVDCVIPHSNPQELPVLDGLRNQRFLQSPDREFGTKTDSINQILCNNSSLVTLVTSANPHEASSFHSNIAFVVKRKIWQDAFASEEAVAILSGAQFPNTFLSDFKEENKNPKEEPLTAQLLTEGKIKRALLRDLDSMTAGESIDLAMFYLSDRQVIKALKDASARGVNLRIILDPNKDAFSREKNGIPNRQVGFELTKASVSVRWYDTHGEQFHTKLIILHKKNRTIVYGGSANYTRRNLNDLNLESVIRITSVPTSEFASRVDSYFSRIWENKDGNYTLDFPAYKDTSKFKVLLYRFQEFSGFSSF